MDREGGSASGLVPHETLMSSVSSSSTREPLVNTSHCMKQLDFHASPSILTLCIATHLTLWNEEEALRSDTHFDEDMTSSSVRRVSAETICTYSGRSVQYWVTERDLGEVWRGEKDLASSREGVQPREVECDVAPHCAGIWEKRRPISN